MSHSLRPPDAAVGAAPPPDEDEEAETFRLFASRLDVRRLTRSQWRSMAYGTERQNVQRILLRLAASKRGVLAERLALYQAAYAVLPLNGPALQTLADSLLADADAHNRPVAREWASVLVRALSQRTLTAGVADAAAADLLTALRRSATRDLASGPEDTAGRAFWRCLARQTRALGFAADWS